MIRRPPTSTRTELAFPTRRSSDLVRVPPLDAEPPPRPAEPRVHAVSDADAEALHARILHMDADVIAIDKPAGLAVQGRSEEHTSELQSLMRISYAIFRLKKKNKENHEQQNN